MMYIRRGSRRNALLKGENNSAQKVLEYLLKRFWCFHCPFRMTSLSKMCAAWKTPEWEFKIARRGHSGNLPSRILAASDKIVHVSSNQVSKSVSTLAEWYVHICNIYRHVVTLFLPLYTPWPLFRRGTWVMWRRILSDSAALRKSDLVTCCRRSLHLCKSYFSDSVDFPGYTGLGINPSSSVCLPCLFQCMWSYLWLLVIEALTKVLSLAWWSLLISWFHKMGKFKFR